MKIEIYHDGIAFYTDDRKHEIAFYSNITDNVRYYNENGYNGWISFNCSCIPYEDNMKIMDEIKKYKRALEAGI